jgi:hypothetical protein
MTFAPTKLPVTVGGKKVKMDFFLPKDHVERFMYYLPSLDKIPGEIQEGDVIGGPRSGSKFKKMFSKVKNDENNVRLSGN